ncbi:MAG: hypothetical protein M1331_03230 [Candidatus Marsarchaeota archaeon]|nr:hypothetical protein [Candidatus Marsarchaeota archaeon]MCL5106379.1 hypothetical protein [Candidatus Marsarchaeota archaeon]
MIGRGGTTKSKQHEEGNGVDAKKFIRIGREHGGNTIKEALLYNASMALKSAEYFEKQVGGARTSNYFQECIENLNEIALLSRGKPGNKIAGLIEDVKNRQLVQILRSFDERKASIN